MNKGANLTFTFLTFDELSRQQLYDMLKLRFDVFVLEQTCFYDEFDRYDENAVFLLVQDGRHVVGCTRITEIEGKTHIGRVVVDKSYRKMGVAREMMNLSIDYCRKKGRNPMYVSAQRYLSSFYESLSFIPIAAPYDWDGIEHIDMELK